MSPMRVQTCWYGRKAEATDVAKCPIHEIVGTIGRVGVACGERGARHHLPQDRRHQSRSARRDAELLGQTAESERKIRRRKRRSRRPDRALGRGVRRFPARSEALIRSYLKI